MCFVPKLAHDFCNKSDRPVTIRVDVPRALPLAFALCRRELPHSPAALVWRQWRALAAR